MLFGRESECRAIEGVVDEARASRSAALVVRGEPGIGKSALLQYAVERPALALPAEEHDPTLRARSHACAPGPVGHW